MHRPLAGFAATVMLLLTPIGGRAQNVSEPALKAAFILNFAKFTEWPADRLPPSAPLGLCSTDPAIATELDIAVAGKLIDQHPLVVRLLRADDDVAQCAVLFTVRPDAKRFEMLRKKSRQGSVLTIGDSAEFAEAGGVIGLFVEGGRMRFAVNVSAATDARLKLSAKLLALARVVGD